MREQRFLDHYDLELQINEPYTDDPIILMLDTETGIAFTAKCIEGTGHLMRELAQMVAEGESPDA